MVEKLKQLSIYSSSFDEKGKLVTRQPTQPVNSPRKLQQIILYYTLQANPPLVRPHKPIKSNKNDLEISSLGLHFVVSSQHFINGRLKVRMLLALLSSLSLSLWPHVMTLRRPFSTPSSRYLFLC